MDIPAPIAGLVISYSYLWLEEAANGQIEGRKDRPCAVIIAYASGSDSGQTIAVVAPITHAEPMSGSDTIELPERTRRRLGLDDQRSWLVLDQFNRFHWPGFDLRGTPRDPDTCVYGMLPGTLLSEAFTRLRNRRPRLPSIDRDG